MMVRDTARSFADKELAPIVRDANRDETFDPDLMKAFGAAGLLGPTIDGYGCAGASYVAYGLIAREIERIDSAYRSAMSVQSSLVMHPIHAYGTEEQRAALSAEAGERRVDRRVRSDRTRCGQRSGRHEDAGEKGPRMGSGDWRRLYVLNGAKMWITNSPIAQVFVVWAKDDDGDIRGFVLERGDKGLSTPKIEGKFSLRAWVTGEIVMEDVRIPADRLLPNVKGLKGPFGCLNKARYGISWGAMGAAEFCWHAARQYGLDRKQFGKPLARTQLFQKKLADMQTEITLGLLGSWRAGQADGRGAAGAGGDQHPEAQQLRQGAGDRPPRARHARRQRRQRRIWRHPPRHEPGGGQHL